jgi:hypothetical protein
MRTLDLVFTTVVAALVVNAVVLAARIWTRLRLKQAFGYDDTALCITFVSIICHVIFPIQLNKLFLIRSATAL